MSQDFDIEKEWVVWWVLQKIKRKTEEEKSKTIRYFIEIRAHKEN